MKKLRLDNRLKKKEGAISVEAAAVIMLTFPTLLLFLVGSFTFFSAHSKNLDINYEAGRYASMAGCKVTSLSTSITNDSRFDKYAILVSEGSGEPVQLKDGTGGRIYISCAADSKKGNEFTVLTSYPVNSGGFGKFFPLNSTYKGIYIQEGA